MKKLIILFIAGLLFASCYKDKGNYSYGTVSEFSIDSLRTRYNINRYDSLKITPVITSDDPTEEFDGIWFIYEPLHSRVDTISTGINLSWRADVKMATYEMGFKARSRKTGVEQLKQFSLVVSSASLQGVYVLKSVDGIADLDFFPHDSLRVPVYNFFSSDNSLEEVPLKGNAVSITSLTAYTEFEGTTTQRFALVSEQNAVMFDPERTQVTRKEDVIFPLGLDGGFGVEKIFNGGGPYPERNYGVCAINKGRMHRISGFQKNLGMFINTPMEVPEDDQNFTFEYRLSPYGSGIAGQAIIVFDEISRSFFYTKNDNASLDVIRLKKFGNGGDTTLKLFHGDYDLIFMGTKFNDVYPDAVVYMKNHQDPNDCFVVRILGDVGTVNATTNHIADSKKYKVAPDAPILSAKFRAHAPNAFDARTYYIEGSKIKYYDYINASTGDIMDLPESGEVAFFRTDWISPQGFHLLQFGIVNGGAYSVYQYEMHWDASGPVFSFKLEGRGRPVGLKDARYMKQNSLNIM